jgi:3-oxoacyl-[acyl-carrier protein] reductase
MLQGKTALVTGASRGIGRGIAIKYADHGAFVGINYLSDDREAEKTLRLVRNAGGEGLLLKGDVSRQDEVQKIVKQLISSRKTIDILVNNAGIYHRNSFDKLTVQDWERIIAVNLTSSYLMCSHVLPYMRPLSRIIFISSQLAFRGSPHGSDYAASKAGVLGLMRSLALELADRKILVNAIAPGTIDTDIIRHYTPQMRQARINEIPLERLGSPEDIANACLFFASDLSTYITGETLNVNGGLYIH